MLEAFPLDHIVPTDNQVSPTATACRVVMTGEISADVLDLLQHAGLLLSSAKEPDVAFDSAASDANVVKGRVSVELDFSLACKTLEHEAAHLTFIYDSPECFIAKALEKGDSLDSAVGSCREYIESILNVYRGNRRRITLMELQAVTANPTAALEVIERRAGVPSKQLDSHHSYNSQADVGDVASLVAACLQEEDYDLKRVVKELAASSALNGDHRTESVARRLLALRDESSARIGEAKRKEAENELLLLQLHQLQEELETYFERHQQSDKKLDACNRVVEGLEKDLEELRSINLTLVSEHEAYATQFVDADRKLEECNRVVKDLEKELEALRSQNLELVTELETYFNQYTETDKRLNECSRHLEARDRQNAELTGVVKYERKQLEFLNEQLRRTRQTVSAMEHSKSWKLTAPLRWFLGIFLPSDR